MVAIVSGAWLLAWLFGLSSRALGEPDEGRYAEVAYEMFTRGDWVTPRLDGFNFFDKPPLQYWATTAAYSLFGPSAWTARLWPAITGLCTLLCIAWAGGRVYGGQTGGYAAAILGSALLFVLGAHLNTLDMGVAAFLAVGMCCFLVAQFDPSAAPIRFRLNLMMWLALALAVLSKGLIGIVLPGMVLVVYMVWQRDWGILKRISLVPGFLLVLAVCTPWFAAMIRMHPDFSDYFFVREHFARFLTTADNRAKIPGFFLPVVLLGLFPWMVFVPLNRTGWRALQPGQPATRFLLVWVGLIFLFFSISRSQLPFYILPVFPALALLLGVAASCLGNEAIRRRLYMIAALAGAGATLGVVAMLLVRTSVPKDISDGVFAGFAMSLAVMGAAAWVGAVLMKRGRRSVALHSLALATLIGWQLTLLASAPLFAMRSALPASRIIRPLLKPATEIFTVDTYLRGLPFYLGRRVTVADPNSDDITPGVPSQPDRFIGTLDEFIRRWRASPDAVAVVSPKVIDQLRAGGLPFREAGRTEEGVVIVRAAPPSSVGR